MNVKSSGTRKIHDNVMKNFDRFSKECYGDRSSNEVFDELTLVKDRDMELVYSTLQKWISWNHKNGIAPTSSDKVLVNYTSSN